MGQVPEMLRRAEPFRSNWTQVEQLLSGLSPDDHANPREDDEDDDVK
jgi:hypothetical protein